MRIIVEGPDNAGKSTLVAFLSHQLALPVHHSGGPAKSPEEARERATRFLAMDNVVFDRFPLISEPIYCGAIRGAPDPYEGSGIEEKLRLLRPVMIYCRPPVPRLLNFATHQEKERAYDTKEHLEGIKRNALAIVQRYDAVMATWDCLHHSYTGDPELRNLIVRYIKDTVQLHG